MATTNSTTFAVVAPRTHSFSRDLAETVIGFAAILLVLWLPTRDQLILGPVALLVPLGMVLAKRPTAMELGLGLRGFISSLWILPAAVGLTIASRLVAQRIGTFHALYSADIRHAGGYVLWTFYQQFLLQDYFMPRLARILSSNGAIAVAAVLFALAHLPNPSLTIATLVWGAASCLLFRRYRSLYVLGLAQGILGLSFGVCVPDYMHHHMRVGLGYLRYHAIQ